jgi:hypothetical protein
MIRTGILLGLFLAAALLRAEEPVPATTTPTATPAPVAEPAKVSAQITGQITAALPKFNPPPPPAEAKPANAPNPDVLELPKMRVRPKPRPRLTPEVVITVKGEADKNMGALDRSLNSLTLPFFGQSYLDRIRDEKERSKNEQMRKEALEMAKTADVTDPALAKALRDAVK